MSNDMKDYVESLFKGEFDPNFPPPCCTKEQAIQWYSTALVYRGVVKLKPRKNVTMKMFCSDCTMPYRAKMTEKNKCIKSILEYEDE